MKRNSKKDKRILTRLIIIAFLFMVTLCVINGIQKYLTGPIEKADTTFDPAFELRKHSDAKPDIFIDANKIYSPNAILVRLNDSAILMDKNSQEKIYPASLTKIMTVLTALEELSDYNKTITLSPAIFQTLYEENASLAGFKGNEKARAIDLLYGAMLPSGAECCIGLAEAAAGSEMNFVSLMNQKAKQLNMKHTHFENVSGLHDPNHYTTVSDLAVLLEYALKNQTFREIFTAFRHTTSNTNVHPEGFTFSSTLSQKMNRQELEANSILGGKTGYTNQAGLCLASLSQIENTEYIFISAGADGDNKTEPLHIKDACTVYSAIQTLTSP